MLSGTFIDHNGKAHGKSSEGQNRFWVAVFNENLIE
jgi:hypothetical protein